MKQINALQILIIYYVINVYIDISSTAYSFLNKTVGRKSFRYFAFPLSIRQLVSLISVTFQPVYVSIRTPSIIVVIAITKHLVIIVDAGDKLMPWPRVTAITPRTSTLGLINKASDISRRDTDTRYQITAGSSRRRFN